MSEPEHNPIAIECIGCGTKNPAGARVCAGCGHVFAGPVGGVVHESITEMANRLAPPTHVHIPRPIAKGDPSLLGCLINAMGVILASVLVIAAFVIAFFVTCSSLWAPNSDAALGWGLVAGVCAAAAVIVFFVWLRSVVRSRK